MKVVPRAFYQSPAIRKLMRDGDCCVIHKIATQQDLDNHRLLSAHALTLVINGGLMVHNDEGLPTKVNSGQMVLLPKGLYAITDLIPEGASFEAVVYFFDDAVIDEYLSPKGLAGVTVYADPKPVRFTVSRSFTTFTEQLLTLYEQVKAEGPVVKMKLLEALHVIEQKDPKGEFLACLQELKARPRKDLALFMNRHFDKPLGVEDYARLSGRSVSTFRRNFHRQFGESPRGWLIAQRLQKAQMLLKKTRLTVASVAEQSGYSDLPHFIKSFQKAYSLTPKQYALSQRN